MKTKQNKKKNRVFIHQLYYKNRINFIVTIILTIAMSSLNLMISWLIQQIMDCTANQDMQALVRSAWIVIIVVVIYTIANVMYRAVYPRFLQRAMQQSVSYTHLTLPTKRIV